MNYKMMGKFIAQILFLEAVFMIPAALISLGFGVEVLGDGQAETVQKTGIEE